MHFKKVWKLYFFILHSFFHILLFLVLSILPNQLRQLLFSAATKLLYYTKLQEKRSKNKNLAFYIQVQDFFCHSAPLFPSIREKREKKRKKAKKMKECSLFLSFLSNSSVLQIPCIFFLFFLSVFSSSSSSRHLFCLLPISVSCLPAQLLPQQQQQLSPGISFLRSLVSMSHKLSSSGCCCCFVTESQSVSQTDSSPESDSHQFLHARMCVCVCVSQLEEMF